MTALQKLRHYRGLLVGLILFALFAFVLGEVISSRDRIFSGSRTTVASVNGKKLNIDQYRTKTNELLEANKQYKVGYGVASAQVYENWLTETLLEQQYEQAGVTVGPRGVMNGVLALPDVGSTSLTLTARRTKRLCANGSIRCAPRWIRAIPRLRRLGPCGRK